MRLPTEVSFYYGDTQPDLLWQELLHTMHTNQKHVPMHLNKQNLAIGQIHSSQLTCLDCVSTVNTIKKGSRHPLWVIQRHTASVLYQFNPHFIPPGVYSPRRYCTWAVPGCTLQFWWGSNSFLLVFHVTYSKAEGAQHGFTRFLQRNGWKMEI